MFRRLRKPITNKQTMKIVSLVNKTKKFLAIIGMLGIIWSSGPMQYLNAMTNEINEMEIINLDEGLFNDFEMPNYPSTSDIDFDPSQVGIDYEVISERDFTSKVFHKVDGTYEVALYNDIVHYLENGEYHQVDNSLVDIGTEYENLANKFKLKFPKKLDDNKQIKLSMDGYSIDWSVLNINSSDIEYDDTEITPNNIKELVNINQSILYRNIQPNVDIEYILTGSKVKENIILNQYVQDFSMTFEYKLKDLEIVEDVDGNILFVNESDETVFLFSDLFMIDTEMNESFDIEFSFVETGNKTYEITITPNDEWLQNASYPVQIDPSLVYHSYNNEITYYDTYVRQHYPNNNYHTSSFIYTGEDVWSDEYHGLVKFTIPTEIRDRQITYAFMTMYGTSFDSGELVYLYENLSSFNSSSVTWNTKPNYEGLFPVDYVQKNFENKYVFDITTAVANWVNNGVDYVPGFTLAMQYNSGDYEYFYSEEYSNSSKTPVFTFGYIETAGVKDYWTYNSQSVEEAGTGLVSDFTGRMYFNRTDVNFSTEKQSFGLSLIYSVDRYSSDIGYGDGWRTNYSMKLKYDSNVETYYSEDASGNIVYYYSQDVCDERVPDNSTNFSYSCYIAEDGSRNVLVVSTIYSSTTYKILTTEQMEYQFGNDEYLDKITNTKFGIDISITRNSTYKDRITKVTDESGNEIILEYSGGTRVDYVELKTKNASGLTTIEKVDYTYDTGGRLTQVEFQSNYNDSALQTSHISTYNYDSSYRLDEITSNSGAHVKYTYNSSKKVTRIDSAKIVDGYYKSYGYVTYEYDTKRTIITDHNGDFINYYFDNFGHTITILDSEGVSQHFRYMNPLVYNIGTEHQPNYVYFKDAPPNYNWNHQKISESQPQITVQNPVSNHSFEYDINNDSTWYNEIDDYAGSTLSPTYYETTTRSVYGDKSAYVFNPVSGQESHMEQQLILEPGTYTISGYVYGTNSTEGWIEVYANGVRHQSTQLTSTGEWQYLEKTFTVTSTGCNVDDNCDVEVRLYNSNYGSVYFDNVQLVTGFRDARKNLVDDASFENTDSNLTPTGWYFSDSNVVLSENKLSMQEYEYVLGDNYIQIWNPGTTLKYASYGLYDLNYNSNQEYNIVVGSFASAYYTSATTVSMADQHTKVFRIRIDFMSQTATATNPNYSTYLIDSAYINFDATADGLQYVMEEVNVPLGTEFINIRYEYEAHGLVYFDNLQVYDRPVFTNYYYNESTGFRTDTIKPTGEQISAQYTEMDSVPTNVQVKNTDGTTTADVNTELTADYYANSVIVNNVKSTPVYNADGQVTSITIGDGATAFTTSTVYSTYENQYVSSTTDEHNKTTYYYYSDITGLLDQVRDANSNDTQFEYNFDGKLYKVKNIDYCQDGSCAEVSYVYEDDLLTKIILTTGFDPNNNYAGYYYELVYDDLDRIISVKVVNDFETTSTSDDFVQELMGYTYNMDGSYYSNQINVQEYGNGDELKFDYNDKDQIEFILFKEYGDSVFEKKFGYEYDHRNRVSALHTYGDNDVLVKSEYYTYDESNNLVRITDNDGNTIKYDYDEQGNLVSLDFKVGSNNLSTDYFYNELFYMDRDILHENNSLNLDIIQSSGVINEETSTIIVHNENDSITVQTSAGSKDPSFGGVIAVQPSSSYTLSMDISSLSGEVRYNIFQFSGNPYEVDNYLGETLMKKSTTSSLTGTRSYTFTTDASTKYIIISLFDHDPYTITFDNMVLDYNGEEMSNLYDKTVYTTIGGTNVVKDYNYEQSALYRLNNIKTTIGSTYFNQSFNFVGNTTRIQSISYDFDTSSTNPDTYKYEYLYDDLGNITDITYYESDIEKMKYHYEYDALNQLIQEDVYEFGNCTTYSESSCYTKYYKYDLRGNITDVKWYDYGELETVDATPPSFEWSYNSSIEVWGTWGTYDDIYNLNVGQTPNTSVTFVDRDYTILNDSTTLLYSDLDIYTDGYYYNRYRSIVDGNTIYWRIVFKVGDPVGGPNEPEKHIRYTYSTDWLDQLVSYGEVQYDTSGNETGVTTTRNYYYDSYNRDQGNPITITNFYFDHDNDPSTNNTWGYASLEYSGRQLTEIKIYDTSSGHSLIATISYTYSDQGYRTSKTIDYADSTPDQHIDYTLSGDKVLFESDGNYGIIYTYDADGKIISFSYDDNINNGNSYTDYFYVRNQQGDITKIFKVVGTSKIILVEYEYDAWGNILQIDYNSSYQTEAENVHKVNQYFYRGYRYDKEIDLYSTVDGLYDPIIGKYVLVKNPSNVLDSNFADINLNSYAANNPIVYTYEDSSEKGINPKGEVSERTNLDLSEVDVHSLANDFLSVSGAFIFSSAENLGKFLNGFTINYTINSFNGNFWIRTNPMGASMERFGEAGGKALGIGLFVVACAYHGYKNFSNPDLSINDKIAFTTVDIGYSAIIFAVGVAIGGPLGALVAIGVHYAIEHYDLRNKTKEFFRRW